MLNGTTIERVEKGALPRPFTFALGEARGESGQSISREPGTLGPWLLALTDGGLTKLLCEVERQCDYVGPHYEAVRPIPMKAEYAAKFLPDVDGNSFSARFRALLLSTALPLKATIYAE